MQVLPVTAKCAPEMAYQLLDVFSIFGASIILQSDNGREFLAFVIKRICSMWEGLKILHGQPRHSQIQGTVERA